MLKAIGMAAMTGALALAGTARAEGDAARGQDYYGTHCATCHGIEGKGQGPMAGVLVIQPTDLTGLQAGNDGVFPVKRVIYRIDGRDPLVSHGSPMPVYGYFFEGDDTAVKSESGQPIMTSQPVADLVAYLMELQTR